MQESDDRHVGLARTPQPRDDYLVELGDEHDQAGPAFRAYRLVPMEEPPKRKQHHRSGVGLMESSPR